MLQDVFDFSLLAVIWWALRAPLPDVVKDYLKVQFFVVVIYLGLKLWEQTNNYSEIYYWAWWLFTAAQVYAFLRICFWAESSIFYDRILRVIPASWGLWLIWLVGYLSAPDSTRLDWCPDAIFALASLELRRQALVRRSRETSALSA
jgi:hypothetical protein